MPSITTAAEPVTEFPNKYVSPYGNDGIIPLYSSIPILEYQGETSCLPCVVCGKSIVRQEINSSQSLNSTSKKNLEVTTTII